MHYSAMLDQYALEASIIHSDSQQPGRCGQAMRPTIGLCAGVTVAARVTEPLGELLTQLVGCCRDVDGGGSGKPSR